MGPLDSTGSHYDRTDLASVIREYQRQSNLPSMTLSAKAMTAQAREDIRVKEGMAEVDAILRSGN